MNHRLKFILWILPVLGIGLGYACAYVFFHGLLETWHYVGKPGEAVTRIIGVQGGRNLLVATKTGKLYAFEFNSGGGVVLAPQFSWEKDPPDTVDVIRPFLYVGADFFTLPPLLQVVHLYDLEYLYNQWC